MNTKPAVHWLSLFLMISSRNADKLPFSNACFSGYLQTRHYLGASSNAFTISTSPSSWVCQKHPWCCSFSCGLLNTHRPLTFRKGQALNTSPGNRAGLIKLQQWRILIPQTPGSERRPLQVMAILSQIHACICHLHSLVVNP